MKHVHTSACYEYDGGSNRLGCGIFVGVEARRRARKSAAKPGAVRVIPDKRKKAPKHKKPMGDE